VQAVILVGGKGTRLRPLTDTRPKPMMTVVDRPFVAHQIDLLARHGVEHLVFSCGYLPDALREHFGDRSRAGVRISYVVDPIPLGTAGAVRNARDLLEPDAPTVVMNGDVLTDLDLGAVLDQHRDRAGEGTIVLTPVEDPSAFGLVRLRADRSVEAFVEKPAPAELRPGEPFRINAGTYVLEPGLIDAIPEGVECSIEREIFPRVAAAGALYGHPSDAYWLDIGTPSAYVTANVDVLSGRLRTESPTGPAYLGPGAWVHETAVVAEGAVCGAGARVGAGASVRGSVLGERAEIGETALLERCVVGAGATIGAGARLAAGVVVGDAATVEAGVALDAGVRVPTEGRATPDRVGEPEHESRSAT